jgi:acyl-coenzyme A synthetase/AMP-(fatty) acid ligase
MAFGHVVVPINYKLTASAQRAILSTADISLIIYDDPFAGAIDHLTCSTALAASSLLKPTEIGQNEINPLSLLPTDWCCVLYTSGSTGSPKGVPLSHHSQLWWMDKLALECGLKDEVVPVALPFYHMAGFFLPYFTLRVHGTAILTPNFDVTSFARVLSNYPCTFIGTITPILARLVQSQELLLGADLSHVRVIEIGSAPLSDQLYQAIRNLFQSALILNHYGSTEAGWLVFSDHPEGLPTPPLSVGYPLSGLRVKLLGDDPRRGVLAVSGPSVATEYLGLEAETRQRFQDGWFITNDEMYRDDRGFYYFVGRSDDMFKCNGESVYPAEVEARLAAHPDVKAVAVTSATDRIRGNIPIAFVVRHANMVTALELQDFARSTGPKYQYPRQVVFLNEIPAASSGKVDYRLLHEMARKFHT